SGTDAWVSEKAHGASRRYESLLRPRIHGKQPSFRHDVGTQKSQTRFPVRKSAGVKSSRCLHGAFDDGRGKANESVPALGQQGNPGETESQLIRSSPGPGLGVRNGAEAQRRLLVGRIRRLSAGAHSRFL